MLLATHWWRVSHRYWSQWNQMSLAADQWTPNHVVPDSSGWNGVWASVSDLAHGIHSFTLPLIHMLKRNPLLLTVGGQIEGKSFPFSVSFKFLQHSSLRDLVNPQQLPFYRGPPPKPQSWDRTLFSHFIPLQSRYPGFQVMNSQLLMDSYKQWTSPIGPRGNCNGSHMHKINYTVQ